MRQSARGSSFVSNLCEIVTCYFVLENLTALLGEAWRRIRMEFVVEWPMLKKKWKIILFGVVMQYVHGIFTQLAARMHKPSPEPLHDVGFDITPELTDDKHWVSELVFTFLAVSFVLWTFSPFFFQQKRFYTVILWSRLLTVLVVCQVLRMISFSVTQLPGPAFHCRAAADTSSRPWPKHWWQHVVVDVQRQATRSCGDLIFSSHTTFTLTGILAYNEYGTFRGIKAFAWAAGALMSFLIIASRKHYTVDIVVAWYTVPLVFYFLHRRWTTRRPVTGDGEGAVTEEDTEMAPLLQQRQELEEVLVVNPQNGSSPQGIVEMKVPPPQPRSASTDKASRGDLAAPAAPRGSQQDTGVGGERSSMARARAPSHASLAESESTPLPRLMEKHSDLPGGHAAASTATGCKVS